jgi:hypothetical protein
MKYPADHTLPAFFRGEGKIIVDSNSGGIGARSMVQVRLFPIVRIFI